MVDVFNYVEEIECHKGSGSRFKGMWRCIFTNKPLTSAEFQTTNGFILAYPLKRKTMIDTSDIKITFNSSIKTQCKRRILENDLIIYECTKKPPEIDDFLEEFRGEEE